MDFTVTIEASEEELDALLETLATLDAVDIEVGAEAVSETKEPPALDLSTEEQTVLWALQESPGSALRVIHRTATELEESPFDDYDAEDGWNDERQRIRDILWDLQGELTRNDGQLWYATEDAPHIDLS